jgi:hypothetical protein
MLSTSEARCAFTKDQCIYHVMKEMVETLLSLVRKIEPYKCSKTIPLTAKVRVTLTIYFENLENELSTELGNDEEKNNLNKKVAPLK